MNFAHGKRPPSALIPAILLICFFAVAAAVPGQEIPTKSASKPGGPATRDQTTANEDFTLTIAEERITETNFARSTEVELSDEKRGGGRLRLEVGVGVRAQNIDVILRGILGQVRFRASLESLRRRLDRTNPTTTNTGQPPAPQQKPAQ